mgnify:CR=1 FL=1
MGSAYPTIIVRYDQYEVDLEKKMLHVYLGTQHYRATLSLPFKGRLKWLTKNAKKGRLVVKYNIAKRRWYAYIASSTSLTTKRQQLLVAAGIDLGQKIVVVAVTQHGKALLYRGGVLKSAYYYFEKRITALDKMIDKTEEADKAALREERRRLYERRKKRRDQTFTNLARHLAEEFKKHGVNVVFIGFPRYIAHDKAGKQNTNMWSYHKLIQRLSTTLENHGIVAFAVDERFSSRKCAFCLCSAERKTRGLLRCPHGHTLHADVNAALNHLRRGLKALGLEAMPQHIHVESYVPAPSRIIPVTPH